MKREIKFNSLYSSSNYTKNLEKLFANYELFRQKHFSNACIDLLQADYPKSSLLLTHSATGALEMIALALDIQPGDEVILPSYTFVSTANAFALRGAKLVFVDIEMETFGIDPNLVEQVISDKTKAIVCMHYAGHACQIDRLLEIKNKYNLFLIEDAAMAYGSKHRGKALGTQGDFGVVSFDVTKHMSATQGGCLIVNREDYLDKLLSIYHLGTNRDDFEQSKIAYYEWTGLGSKYQMPEICAAVLHPQLMGKDIILANRNHLSHCYYNQLHELESKGIKLTEIDSEKPNYHEFYLVCRNKNERLEFEKFLNMHGVEAMFHYIPLHSSAFGKKYISHMPSQNSKKIGETLIRLPLHNVLNEDDIDYVSSAVKKFYNNA